MLQRGLDELVAADIVDDGADEYLRLQFVQDGVAFFHRRLSGHCDFVTEYRTSGAVERCLGSDGRTEYRFEAQTELESYGIVSSSSFGRCGPFVWFQGPVSVELSLDAGWLHALADYPLALLSIIERYIGAGGTWKLILGPREKPFKCFYYREAKDGK